MNPAPATLDLRIDRAASFSFVASVDAADGTPINIASAVFHADVRDADSYREVCQFTTALVTDGTDGQVRLSLSTTQTKLFREEGSYEYDLFMILSGTTYRLLKGNVTCSENITNNV